jgi:hypothetical protein
MALWCRAANRRGHDMRQIIYRWIAVMCCVIALPTVVQSSQFAGQELAPPPPAMDFSLTAADGGERV